MKIIEEVLFYFVMIVESQDANVALGRPAVQSSLYDNGRTFPPGLAVDGNSDPNFNGYSCSCTNADVMSWWAVDLGRVMFVKYVQVTNRGDCCGQ